MTNPADIPDQDKIVAFRRPKAAKRRSESKWGVEVMDVGYCIVPSLIFRAQSRLGLKSTHLALIMHLADFWWYDDNLPFPKKETLAERLGLKEKQIQRLIRDLELRGYVTRKKRITPHGQTSNHYDLTGLVKKLQQLAPEFQEAKRARQAVEKKGGVKKKVS